MIWWGGSVGVASDGPGCSPLAVWADEACSVYASAPLVAVELAAFLRFSLSFCDLLRPLVVCTPPGRLRVV